MYYNKNLTSKINYIFPEDENYIFPEDEKSQ